MNFDSYITNHKTFAHELNPSHLCDWFPSSDAQTTKEIWYTTTDGLIAEPDPTAVWSPAIKSNTYSNGKGVLLFEDEITSVPDNCFKTCSNLKTLILPSSITTIGIKSFSDCNSLVSIELSNSVTSIQSDAFSSNSNLVLVTFNGTVDEWCNMTRHYTWSSPSINQIKCSDGDVNLYKTVTYKSVSNSTVNPNLTGAFCYEITSNTYDTSSDTGTYTIKTYGSNITGIIDLAFFGVTSLKEINLPDSITSIGKQAFSNTSGLTTITLPANLTSLSMSLFDSSGIKSIIIPANITSIANYVFDNCSNLESISVDENNTIYDSRNNCNAINITSTNVLIQGCKNTIIPSDIVYIAARAFYGASDLTSINIPSSITSIENNSFRSTGLTSITIPSSVSNIGVMAFGYCSALSNVTMVSSTPPTIGLNVFVDASASLVITVPSGAGDTYKQATNWSDYASQIVEQ